MFVKEYHGVYFDAELPRCVARKVDNKIVGQRSPDYIVLI